MAADITFAYVDDWFLMHIEVILFAVLMLGVLAGCLLPNEWLPPLPNDKLMHFGAYAALALLAAFTSVIIGNLRRGNRPPCACFGSRRPTPISWWTVVRNVALMALIVFALLVS